jgi:anti-sigma factor RsiW
MKFGSTERITCRDVLERADAYVDRELPRHGAALIMRHLAGCKKCAALVTERALLKQKVQAGVRSIPVPPQLTPDLQAALKKRNT